MFGTTVTCQEMLLLLLLSLLAGVLSQSQSQSMVQSLSQSQYQSQSMSQCQSQPQSPFPLDYRYSSDAQFCGTPCKNLSLLTDRPLFLGYNRQPFYQLSAPMTSESCQVDNRCFTIFLLTPDTYILYISTVFIDGTNDVNSYVLSVDSLYYYRGAWLNSSPNCTFVDFAFAEISSTVDAIYRCYRYGGCVEEGASCQGSNSDYVFALSTTYEPLDPYTFQQAQNTFCNYGFGNQQFIAYPMRLPSQCVRCQPCRNGVNNDGGGCGCGD